MASATDADGCAGVNAPLAIGAAVIGYVPEVGTLTVTTAKRIDPSGQRVLTSVCVSSEPTCSPLGATPRGTAWPNVAQPAVNVSTAICAEAARTDPSTSNTTADTSTSFFMTGQSRNRAARRRIPHAAKNRAEFAGSHSQKPARA